MRAFATSAAALFVFCATSAMAGTPSPRVDAGFGPAVSGLRLAVSIARDGKTARFRVRNGGRAAVTFAARMSCSGYSSFWLQAGADDQKLATLWAYEPQRAGLTTHPLRTVCTRNGPVELVTVKPGKTADIAVPVAKGEAVAGGSERYVQGHAALWLEGKHPRRVEFASLIGRR